MTHKIFRSIFWTSILVLLISVGLIFGILYENTTDVAKQQLRQQLDLAAQGLEDEGLSYLTHIRSSRIRITWISGDGTVLYDSRTSDTSAMENHAKRKEVREALSSADGYGESTHYSATMTEQMIYCARRMEDGTVLRLSEALDSAVSLLFSIIQPTAVILIFLVFLSVLIANRLSQKVVEPLNSLDLDHPLENEQYDELSPLLRRIQSQQEEIREKEDTLRQKQKELDTILLNMNEGMLLLDKNGSIISMNPAAGRILGVDSTDAEGASLLTLSRNMDIAALTEDALQGQGNEKVLRLQGGDYQVGAAPIREGDTVIGAALVMFDVTDREMAESMRREFTANVSHELKTPLHAISGYAELMMNGMIKETDVSDCAGRIYRETHRMIRLVEDIISLSHLDEGADDIDWEEADLYEIAEGAVRQLTPAADAKHITIACTGSSAVLTGKVPLLTTIVTNLLDNAVKYTPEGGHVAVDVTPLDDSVRLAVRDDGIGIPAADQKRIFERFYRVDKSHSKEIGGTGLGLSIVKHAVLVHHGQIDLESAPGKGSVFTVTLPAQ